MMERSVNWRTDSVYVDEETGEIIKRKLLESLEYIKSSKTINYENKGNYRIRKITIGCRRNQKSIFD
jgi:hypothetical protein